jgi:hypothetical protein
LDCRPILDDWKLKYEGLQLRDVHTECEEYLKVSVCYYWYDFEPVDRHVQLANETLSPCVCSEGASAINLFPEHAVSEAPPRQYVVIFEWLPHVEQIQRLCLFLPYSSAKI